MSESAADGSRIRPVVKDAVGEPSAGCLASK